MPKCPKCSAEIDHLSVTSISQENGEMRKGLDFSWTEGEIQSESFSCSSCGEQLFTDINEAEEFLEGAEQNAEQDTTPA